MVTVPLKWINGPLVMPPPFPPRPQALYRYVNPSWCVDICVLVVPWGVGE